MTQAEVDARRITEMKEEIARVEMALRIVTGTLEYRLAEMREELENYRNDVEYKHAIGSPGYSL